MQVARVDAVLVECLGNGAAAERPFRNPEPEQRLLERPDCPVGSEQPHPQVDVLVAPRPLGIAETAQDFGPHHHRRMGERRAPVQRRGAFRRVFGVQPDSAEFRSVRAGIEFLDAAAEDGQRVVRRELRGLLLEPPWQADVVRVHARHKLRIHELQAKVERVRKPPVFLIADGVKREPFLPFGDDGLQLRRKRAVLHEDDLLRQERVARDALERLGEEGGIVLAVDGLEDGEGHFKNSFSFILTPPTYRLLLYAYRQQSRCSKKSWQFPGRLQIQ